MSLPLLSKVYKVGYLLKASGAVKKTQQKVSPNIEPEEIIVWPADPENATKIVEDIAVDLGYGYVAPTPGVEFDERSRVIKIIREKVSDKRAFDLLFAYLMWFDPNKAIVQGE